MKHLAPEPDEEVGWLQFLADGGKHEQPWGVMEVAYRGERAVRVIDPVEVVAPVVTHRLRIVDASGRRVVDSSVWIDKGDRISFTQDGDGLVMHWRRP